MSVHFIDIIFPTRTIGDDKIDLSIEFTVNQLGPREIYISSESGMRIEDYGKLSWKYDLEKQLLVPGNYDFRVSDSKGILRNIIFGEDPNIDIKGEVELKINNVVDFKGPLKVPFKRSSGSNIFSLSVVPRTDLLNRSMLYDFEGVPLNPLAQIDPVQYETRVFDSELNIYEYIQELPSNANYPLVRQVVHDIFKTINPGISFEYSHNWKFKALRTVSPFDYIYDGTFDELRFISSYLFLWSKNGERNLGDSLRTIAKQFCSLIGMLSQDKAFMKKLFYFDPDNTQDLIKVYDHSEAYEYEPISYVRVENNFGFDAQGNEVEITAHAPSAEAFTELEDDYIKIVAPVLYEYFNIKRAGVEYGVEKLKDLTIEDTWKDIDQGIADFWYYWRGDFTKLKKDYFLVKGLGYSFLKDFYYKNRGYQILELTKNIDDGESEINALRVI